MILDKFIERDRMEVVAKRKQKKEHKLIGSMKHRDGLTLFSINTKTCEVKPAAFVVEEFITWEQALRLCKTGSVKKKVQVEKDCIYLEALNAKNAIKHYNNLNS